jgi:hypothetical protein
MLVYLMDNPADENLASRFFTGFPNKDSSGAYGLIMAQIKP